MRYEVVMTYWGINKDGSHDEYIMNFSRNEQGRDMLAEILMSLTRKEFGDKIVSIAFEEPK